MKLFLRRVAFREKYTIGHLFVDGKFLCDTLEDRWRDLRTGCENKVYGETCIPAGTYNIQYVFWAKHQKYYPLLTNTRCFSGIFMHGGQDQDDSEGCILCGENKEVGKLTNCLETMDKIRKLMENEEDITIEIWEPKEIIIK